MKEEKYYRKWKLIIFTVAVTMVILFLGLYYKSLYKDGIILESTYQGITVEIDNQGF